MTLRLSLADLLRSAVLALFFASPGLAADDPAAPKVMLLYPNGAPGAIGEEEVDKPSLTIFAPPADKANGCAVVVCPGGGYGALAIDHEGKQIGEWFNTFGVTAYVLKYRLGARYKHPAPLSDAQRAVRTARANAQAWKLDPNRVGIMGFSAGGHLASSVITHFDAGNPSAEDPIEKVSCRPDFAILCYPVISLVEPTTHAGSKRNLLGDSPDPGLVEFMSSEKQVKAETPPTFIFHTGEDTAVPPENAIQFYMALRKAKVPAELHIYEKGKHGVGLAQNDPVLSSWPKRLEDWLRSRAYVK